MNRPILVCLILLGSLVLNSVMASVTVLVNNDQYEFTQEPRLVEILASIANQDNWYWPSTALYQTDNTQLEETRLLLLNGLSNLIKRNQIIEPEIAQSLEQLQATITSWRLAKRLPIKIDYDLARIVAKANPLLPTGKYILDIAPRKNTVQLFGAVYSSANVPHQDHADVSEYITDKLRTNLANKDYVMLIQADGRKIMTPVAYWNKAHQEVMPGSQLFVLFKQSLFHPEFAIINQQITTLALNRLQ